jgi:PAT family beta-lactamase induction signal transducer AmpG
VSLADRRWLRLFTLCVLYVAQGIPWGFMAITLPSYLAGHGLDAAAVGSALAMTTLPYSFKWAWGPIIDTFTIPSLGRRRPWIVFAQGMMALTAGALILIPDLTADLDALAWMILIHTVFNSMQDVAVDALAVDLLEEDERGRANGLMYASKYAGGVIGGAGLATVIGWYGLRAAILVQTGFLVAIMMVPLLVRERSGPPPKRPKIGEVLRALGKAFRLRSTVLGGVLMLYSTIAIGMMVAVGTVLFVQELGWSQTEFAQITGGPGLMLGLGGSVLGGFLADKVGHRRLAAIAAGTLAVFWFGFAAAEAWWTNRTFIYALFLVEPLCQSVMTVSLFALCMDISWPKIAATQFTTYMALANVSSTLGFKLAGHAQGWWTYRGIYIAAATLQLGVVALLPWIDPTETRRKLPADEPQAG